MSSTRDKILDHARKRFNEDGVDGVAVRDIARDLEMSPGNLSYHFPKKADLIAALAQELAVKNSAAIVDDVGGLDTYMATRKKMFENQTEYRFMVVSIVQLFDSNPELANQYATREVQRRKQLMNRIIELSDGGGLRKLDRSEQAILLAHTTLHARMWMMEARVSFADAPMERVIGHYFHLFADLYRPYATKKGREMLDPYLKAPLLG